MPFLETAPAAAGRGMLRDKNRVAAKWSLFTIIGKEGWSKPLCNEIFGMAEYYGQALAMQVIQILTAQMEASSKSRVF